MLDSLKYRSNVAVTKGGERQIFAIFNKTGLLTPASANDVTLLYDAQSNLLVANPDKPADDVQALLLTIDYTEVAKAIAACEERTAGVLQPA